MRFVYDVKQLVMSKNPRPVQDGGDPRCPWKEVFEHAYLRTKRRKATALPKSDGSSERAAHQAMSICMAAAQSRRVVEASVSSRQ